MNASILDPERGRGFITAQWQGPESPTGFFQFLRADWAYFHRVFSKWLQQAGFEIRWIRRRTNHDLWQLYLMRGTVIPGLEAQTARDTICATLKRCGADCRPRDIEVAVIGNRVGAAFIFDSGTPGSLVYSRGREAWCADEWP